TSLISISDSFMVSFRIVRYRLPGAARKHDEPGHIAFVGPCVDREEPGGRGEILRLGRLHERVGAGSETTALLPALSCALLGYEQERSARHEDAGGLAECALKFRPRKVQERRDGPGAAKAPIGER